MIPTLEGVASKLPLNQKKKKECFLPATTPTLSGSHDCYHSSVRYVVCSPLIVFSQSTSLRNSSDQSQFFYFSIHKMSYHQPERETLALYHPQSQWLYLGREPIFGNHRWGQILRKIPCRWVSALPDSYLEGEVAACPGEREKRLLLPFNVSNILDRDGFCWAWKSPVHRKLGLVSNSLHFPS